MRAPDTSILVAAFSTWHAQHSSAVRALSPGDRLIAHAALETYAVLTRLPPPHRASLEAAKGFLDGFPTPHLGLSPKGHTELIRELAGLGVAGGAVYDGLIAATARHHRAELLTRDRRAVATYEALGAPYRFVG